MNVLIDISHPAHVHFYRHLRQRLIDAGAEVLVVAREKDVTLQLLEAFEIPHLTSGRSGHRGWGGQLGELISRDAFLVRHGRHFRPDVVLTRNPSGVQAARLLRAIGVFDTDDGRSVGVHYRAAAPFAHLITAPDCLPESFGRKERKYPSYKSLAYLHPNVFEPSEEALADLGVRPGERISVLRLVAHDASHDRRAAGIDATARRRIMELLSSHGRVFVSCEGHVPSDVAEHVLPTRPEHLHSVLAAASIVVGDSQTIATEAALVGTPAVRISTWSKVASHLAELELRYGLVSNFAPPQIDEALARIEALLSDSATQEHWSSARARVLEDKIDLTAWYFDLVVSLTHGRQSLTEADE
jgi:predicted glycosyltransferase